LYVCKLLIVYIVYKLLSASWPTWKKKFSLASSLEKKGAKIPYFL